MALQLLKKIFGKEKKAEVEELVLLKMEVFLKKGV
jgi:hypothetical protein